MNPLSSPRLTAWLAVAMAVLATVPVVRMSLTFGIPPVQTADLVAAISLAGFSLASVVCLGMGAWRILRRDEAASGLKWVMAGSVLTFVGSIAPAASLGLVLGAMAWWQSSRLPRPEAVADVSAVPAADTRAMRRLFWVTLAAAVVVLAGVGAYVKIMLDRAGKPTLPWLRGVGYSMILILPFAAGFVALAFGARYLLRKRLAVSPEWVAQFGVPCWIGALAGAAAGGVYGVWPMMMDVEASLIAVLMPWWFAQWQVAGAAAGAAAVYLVLRLSGRGRGPR